MFAFSPSIMEWNQVFVTPSGYFALTTHQAAGSETAQGSDGTPESPGTGQIGVGWWIIVVLLLAAAIGAGVFVVRKRKGEEEESRQ